jgi:hypothetical protein|tara:strand:+ start:275 stop:547 length:273 start_codon:yes stop_codon:yes gene_type:complete
MVAGDVFADHYVSGNVFIQPAASTTIMITYLASAGGKIQGVGSGGTTGDLYNFGSGDLFYGSGMKMFITNSEYVRFENGGNQGSIAGIEV